MRDAAPPLAPLDLAATPPDLPRRIAPPRPRPPPPVSFHADDVPGILPEPYCLVPYIPPVSCAPPLSPVTGSGRASARAPPPPRRPRLSPDRALAQAHVPLLVGRALRCVTCTPAAPRTRPTPATLLVGALRTRHIARAPRVASPLLPSPCNSPRHHCLQLLLLRCRVPSAATALSTTRAALLRLRPRPSVPTGPLPFTPAPVAASSVARRSPVCPIVAAAPQPRPNGMGVSPSA